MNYRRYFTEGRCYFFTHVIKNRSQQTLTQHIDILRSAFKESREQQPFELIACCILPDHLHVLLSLPQNDLQYPKLWGRIKGNFSRKLFLSEPRTRSQKQRRRRGIWQARYWEHEIRDLADLEQHIHYTHLNPVKHGLVDCAGDWPYSSIHKFLRLGLLPSGWDKVSLEQSMRFGEPSN